MATLRNLSVSLTMNSAQFRKEVNKVDKRFKKLSRSAQTWNRTMVRSVGVLSAALGGLSLKHLIKESIDAGDRANKFSQQIGVATETITGLELAADLAGVGMRDVEVGMRRLGRSMSDAKAGLSTQVRAFSDLGISATDAQGNLRAVDDVLRDLSDKFAEMPDGARKVARAQELLGRSGSLLIPMLNGGAKGIETQIELSRELGLVWSKEAAAGAELFNDQLHILKKAGQGVATTFAKQLLPGLNRQLGSMIEFIKENRVEIVKWAKRGLVAAAAAVSYFAAKMAVMFTITMANAVTALPALAAAFGRLMAMKFLAFLRNLGAAMALLATPAGVLIGQILAVAVVTRGLIRVIQGVYTASKDFGSKWTTIWDTVKNVVSAAGDFIVAKIKLTFVGAINSMKELGNEAIALINKFRDEDNQISLFETDTASVDSLQAQVAAAKQTMSTGLGDLGDLAVDLGSNIGTSISDLISSDLDAIAEMPGKALEVLKNGMTALGDFMGETLDSGAEMLGLGGNTDDLGGDGEGTPPAGGSGGFTTLMNSWNNFKNEFGPGMQPILESFDNLGSRISGVFTDALTGVTSFKDGLLGIAKTIGTTVLNAIVNMGVEWIATQVMMKAKGSALQAATLGETAAVAGTTAAAWAPAAAAASTATAGGSAAAGISGMGMAMAAALGLFGGLALSGMAHSGIDNVPSEGTWLLDKGERVLSPRQNADLTNFLANPASQGGQPVTLNVNGVSDPDVVVEALSSRRGELESMIRQITRDNLGTSQ